ncbi:MAG TPA: hypothetical protein VGC56_03950 [Allosphingosinicella sp.]|jgi:hypothetical protein
MTWPPVPVLAVIVGLLVLVPLGSWLLVALRDWGYGGSPAAVLDGPYLWGVLLLRLAGAVLLALLLVFVRKPASVWIAVTSLWLAGPPLQMLLTGIVLLSASAGQQSLPPFPLRLLLWWSIGPAVATLCLLGFRSSRKAYGISSNP